MFEALGRVMYRRRRWVVALSVAFVVFAGVWGTGVFGAMTGGGFEDPDSESSKAAEVAAQALGRNSPDAVVLYRSDRLTVDDPAFRSAVEESLAAAPQDLLARTTTFWGTGLPALVSTDRHATYAVLQFADDTDDEDAIAAIRDDVHAPGLTTRIGGNAVVNQDINDRVSADIARAETISMPILLVLLVLIFGSFAAASLPLAIGVTAILGAFTALRAFALFTDVSIFAVNIVTITGLGLAIDYGLFVVSRFREEIRRQPDVETALARTMATAGRTVAVSGVTVAISVAGLLIFPQVFLRSMGFGGMSAVLIAMIAALTLLPALLAMLGPKVDALSVRPWLRRVFRRPVDLRADTAHGLWYRIAHSVMRRPVFSVGGAPTGRRNTRRSHGRTDSASTFGPSSASSAGSRVSAASIATRTALMPPKPIERRNTCGKISRPASETATVTPETATVRPAVAIVRASALSTSGWRRISSRNRLTMNSP